MEFQPDVGWRAYIIFQLTYQSQGNGLQFPYQSIDHNGRRYVNWSAKIDSLGEAKVVAALWAELIHRYERAEEQRTNNNEPPKGSRRLQQLRADAA